MQIHVARDHERGAVLRPVVCHCLVRVVLADAEAGVPEHGPYDRIVVTVGMWDEPARLSEQLSESGRLVVPLRLRGLRRSVCLTRAGAGLVSVGHIMAGFVDVLRGWCAAGAAGSLA